VGGWVGKNDITWGMLHRHAPDQKVNKSGELTYHSTNIAPDINKKV
jgi:hypothetical protein